MVLTRGVDRIEKILFQLLGFNCHVFPIYQCVTGKPFLIAFPETLKKKKYFFFIIIQIKEVPVWALIPLSDKFGNWWFLGSSQDGKKRPFLDRPLVAALAHASEWPGSSQLKYISLLPRSRQGGTSCHVTAYVWKRVSQLFCAVSLAFIFLTHSFLSPDFLLLLFWVSYSPDWS